jgi:CheY-like chemotaxis protein
MILLDTLMPDMDGFEFASILKNNSDYSQIPIIMLSSSGEENKDKSKMAEYGISDFLLKPVIPGELINRIKCILEKIKSDNKQSNIFNGPIEPANMNILLVEDNIINQKLAIRLLEKMGHRIEVANDGNEAVQKYQEKNYDLIFMDIQMPNLDGLEATSIIRRMELGLDKHIPIVALTAHAMKGDREQCLSAGMDDYLSKPIHVEELKQVVEKYKRSGFPHCEKFI